MCFHAALIQSSSLETYFSNSLIIQRVVILPRHTNFVTCIMFETPVKHLNEALSTGFIIFHDIKPLSLMKH